MKKHVVIVPGLGDRSLLYRLVKPLWKMYGYEVHVFVFGWENEKQSFDAGIRRFVDFIDDLPSCAVYIVGASAGGMAAVQAMAARPKIVKKVVTICTPYQTLDGMKNQRLIDSYKWVDDSLRRVGENILSLYSSRDGVVPEFSSKPDGVKSKRISTSGHAQSIIAGLTIYSPVILRFFR